MAPTPHERRVSQKQTHTSAEIHTRSGCKAQLAWDHPVLTAGTIALYSGHGAPQKASQKRRWEDRGSKRTIRPAVSYSSGTVLLNCLRLDVLSSRKKVKTIVETQIVPQGQKSEVGTVTLAQNGLSYLDSASSHYWHNFLNNCALLGTF